MKSLFLVILFYAAQSFCLTVEKNIKFNKEIISFEKFLSKKNDPTLARGTLVFESNAEEVLIIRESKFASLKLAAADLKKKIQQVDLMYREQVSQYPGMITKKFSCGHEVDLMAHILKNENEESVYFSLPGNKIYKYGSCFSGDEAFHSQFLLLLCKKKKIFYEIKYFFSKKKEYLKKAIAECES